LCAKIDEKNWHLLLKALQEAIKKSCVQLEVGEKYPVRVWVKINGTLHEARITNAMTGEYHGFPLEYESQLPDDPHDLLSNVPNVNVPIS
jgi:hypothetical protein